MAISRLRVTRLPEQFVSDDRRVIPRYLDFRHGPRIRGIIRRVMKIPDGQVSDLLARIMERYDARHRDLRAAFAENYKAAIRGLTIPPAASEDRKTLIGAYFTGEYAIEAAALFNPSVVMHPDQGNLPPGTTRFLMSLRATGEGHISSIVFRRGVIDASGRMTFDPPARWAISAMPLTDECFDKAVFRHRLEEISLPEDLIAAVCDGLADPFTPEQLEVAVKQVRASPEVPSYMKDSAGWILWAAKACYGLEFPADCRPAEMVIFPATEYEHHGMEDLRLVRFEDDDGHVRFCGTYTAYDGSRTYPMLLETGDFRSFHVRPLSGRFARNKGMALFPRKVNGRYLMLSRHDGENIYLLNSPNLYAWNDGVKLLGPAEPWELIQVGNCGSPLETKDGWVLLTHGVGPVREYRIGAALLDLHDPSRVVGRLSEPLLAPTDAEREGYVPNVVYSCGSMIHNGRLIVPYAMSDSRTTFATVAVDQLIDHLLRAGP